MKRPNSQARANRNFVDFFPDYREPFDAEIIASGAGPSVCIPAS